MILDVYFDDMYLGLWHYVHDMLAGPKHLHLRCLTASTSLTEEGIDQSRPERIHSPRVQPSRCLLCGDALAPRGEGWRCDFSPISPILSLPLLGGECLDLGESSFSSKLAKNLWGPLGLTQRGFPLLLTRLPG